MQPVCRWRERPMRSQMKDLPIRGMRFVCCAADDFFSASFTQPGVRSAELVPFATFPLCSPGADMSEPWRHFRVRVDKRTRDLILAAYPFPVSGFATSRAQSMKSCATGFGMRFLSVTIPIGPLAIDNSTGNFLMKGCRTGNCSQKLWNDRKITAGAQEIGSHFECDGDYGRSRHLEAAGAKHVHDERSESILRRWQRPHSSTKSPSELAAIANKVKPGLLVTRIIARASAKNRQTLSETMS